MTGFTAPQGSFGQFAADIQPSKANIVTAIPILATPRLQLGAFGPADAPALAAILAEPEVTKCITADGSTPERCRAAAEKRIAWHNGAWDAHGYGIWALRPQGGADAGDLIGWCGFVPPDIGGDPEILYGLAPRHWRRGLAREAAIAAIDWLFAERGSQGVTAVVFGRLNPASTGLLARLGLTPRGTMAMADFLPDLQLAREVLDYELWRLGHGRCADAVRLLFEAPHKGGQIATLFPAEIAAREQAFVDAAIGRADFAAIDPAVLARRVRDAFAQGMAEPWLDWHHLARHAWRV